MAGQVNIGGNTASVQLTGNDDITADQEIGFPNTDGADSTVVVSPTTQDLETTGQIQYGSYLISDGRLQELAGDAGIYLALSTTGAGQYEVMLKNDGRGIFTGNITAPNVNLRLEQDNPDAWEAREETYEEVKEYIGKTLDVRETLLSLLERATAQDAVIADLTRQLTELKGGSN